MTQHDGLWCRDLVLTRDGFSLAADWAVGKGSKVAILGPSGAGKSTLLAAIAGFLPAQSGEIMWEAAPLPARPDKRPISMIFQDSNLFPHLTAFQNVGLGISPRLKLDDVQVARIETALGTVGLESYKDRKPGNLSGGQQARVTLARALVREQPLLLLDEPFGALGPALGREMAALVLDVVETLSATLFVVTHNPEEALALADLGIVVADGVAQAPQDLADLLSNPPDTLRAYL